MLLLPISRAAGALGAGAVTRISSRTKWPEPAARLIPGQARKMPDQVANIMNLLDFSSFLFIPPPA